MKNDTSFIWTKWQENLFVCLILILCCIFIVNWKYIIIIYTRYRLKWTKMHWQKQNMEWKQISAWIFSCILQLAIFAYRELLIWNIFPFVNMSFFFSNLQTVICLSFRKHAFHLFSIALLGYYIDLGYNLTPTSEMEKYVKIFAFYCRSICLKSSNKDKLWRLSFKFSR